MANNNIYNVNWRKLLLWLIPTPLRKLYLLQWLIAITWPLQRLFNQLLSFRDFTLYWLGINSQVCYLEKMLNDRYDPILRRIYIERPPSFDPTYIFLSAELKPVYLYTAAENNPIHLWTKGETLIGGVDFYVVVPFAVGWPNFIEMNALIDKNKLPDKENAIKRI